MRHRRFGRGGFDASEIGFGGWAIGGTWGEVSEEDALAALRASLEAGVTFLDTADVYGDGRSERLIAQVLKDWEGPRPVVATKLGRRLDPHVAEGYTAVAIESFVDRSLRNLEVDCLDLVQLHCPPTEVFYKPEVFAALDDLQLRGKISAYGVSVEKVEEGLIALEWPGVTSIQIIFNVFRQRPAELLFPRAAAAGVGIIARVPLASGLLTGKLTSESRFAADDHRSFNREGAAFDRGETFSGVPFDVGLAAVEAMRATVPLDVTMAQMALRWILMHDAVTTVIPGAKNAAQAAANAVPAELPALDAAAMAAIRSVYDEHIAGYVHRLW